MRACGCVRGGHKNRRRSIGKEKTPPIKETVNMRHLAPRHIALSGVARQLARAGNALS